MNRKAFLKSMLTGAAGCMALPCCAGLLQAGTEVTDKPASSCDAAYLRDWLSQFVEKEERQFESLCPDPAVGRTGVYTKNLRTTDSPMSFGTATVDEQECLTGTALR